MSRDIKVASYNTNIKEQELQNTESGKLIFTNYKNKPVALLLRNNRLLAAQVMSENSERIGAIYIGKIKNVVKNIDACFLEITNGEICFLSMKDAQTPVLLNRSFDGRLLEGDEILVQITKEVQKSKQASVTANVSLANEYAAISIGSRRIGFSSKIDGLRREEIKGILIHANMQSGTDFIYTDPYTETNADYSETHLSLGLIIRTKAKDCDDDVLLQNIQLLLDEFLSMIHTAKHRTCFTCIRPAPENYESILNQLVYSHEYEEIITDDAALYEKLVSCYKNHIPYKQVRLYDDETFSLSKLYSLESKMDTALNKRVWLKSGGYLIIEHTEALTVIDVNTGKYEAPKDSHGKSASQAAYEKINREAAEEIALQLRLRNLSGIILVDFINMSSPESRDALVALLREVVRTDKQKTIVVDITPLGLVEITRKKGNKPLREQFNEGKDL